MTGEPVIIEYEVYKGETSKVLVNRVTDFRVNLIWNLQLRGLSRRDRYDGFSYKVIQEDKRLGKIKRISQYTVT